MGLWRLSFTMLKGMFGWWPLAITLCQILPLKSEHLALAPPDEQDWAHHINVNLFVSSIYISYIEAPHYKALISISLKPQRATSSTLFWPFDCFQWAHISVGSDLIYMVFLPSNIDAPTHDNNYEEESIISAAQRFKTHHLSGPAAALAIGSRLKRHNRHILAVAARGKGSSGR